jgi:hypothetical protein
MNNLTKIIYIVFLCTVFYIGARGQSNDLFVSGEGGFKINLPKNTTRAENFLLDYLQTGGHGKTYIWEDPQNSYYSATYHKFNISKKSLAPAETKLLFDTFKEELLKIPKEKGFPVKESPFFINGLRGTEIRVILPQGVILARFAAVGKRIYFLSMTFRGIEQMDEAVKILDSFQLLDSKSLIAVKIEEAMPKSLPQSPVAEKLKSDAQDSNLKGKVKSVIEDTQELPSIKRARFSEQYYNETGNLVKEISYEEGYPSDVTVWGYIDGNRVNNLEFIDFDDDQRPPMENVIIRGTPVGEEKPNLPKDERYDSKHKYRYDEQSRLVEKWIYANNESLRSRTIYNYNETKRTEINYGVDGSEWSQTVEFLDEDGNVIERHLLDENGKANDKTIYSYEFDSQGNWVVEKISKKVTVKGKTSLKPWSSSYRTITYYP